MRASLAMLALAGTVLTSSASAATTTVATSTSSGLSSIVQILYPGDPIRVFFPGDPVRVLR